MLWDFCEILLSFQLVSEFLVTQEQDFKFLHLIHPLPPHPYPPLKLIEKIPSLHKNNRLASGKVIKVELVVFVCIIPAR